MVGTAQERLCPPYEAKPDDVSASSDAAHAYLPWQCLYFLPEPQGQSSLRPTLPQLAGFFGSRFAVAAGTNETLANAISSSPVLGSSLWASMTGKAGCWSS